MTAIELPPSSLDNNNNNNNNDRHHHHHHQLLADAGADELAHIVKVVERDETLRRLEQQRIEKLSHELGVFIAKEQEQQTSPSPSSSSENVVNNNKENDDSSNKNVINCVVCSKRFGFIFNRRKCCFVCKLFVCSNCCLIIVNAHFKVRLCRLCERQRFLRERAFNWFYYCLRERYPHETFGGDWFRATFCQHHHQQQLLHNNNEGSSAIFAVSDAQVQTTANNNNNYDEDVEQLLLKLTKDASVAVGDDGEQMTLRDHCEMELISDLSSLTSEVKMLLNKIDPEEYEAINAISSCYKRRLASLLSQYTKLFYVVLLIASSRETRLRDEQTPCKNCHCPDEHINDEYCRHSELAYAARSVVEQTTSSILAWHHQPTQSSLTAGGVAAIVSPFNDQTVADTPISDFEQQLADLLIDDAVKQTFFGKLDACNANRLVFCGGRIGVSPSLLSPDDDGMMTSSNSGRQSASDDAAYSCQVDEGVHSDLSPSGIVMTVNNVVAVVDDQQAAMMGTGGLLTAGCNNNNNNNNNESLVEMTRFKGKMTDCPKVTPHHHQQLQDESGIDEEELVMTQSQNSSGEENNVSSSSANSNNDDAEPAINSVSMIATTGGDELAFASISPSASVLATIPGFGIRKNNSFNLGQVSDNISEFDALFTRYSNVDDKQIVMTANDSNNNDENQPQRRRQVLGNGDDDDDDDDDDGFGDESFKFCSPNGSPIPVDVIGVNGGERAQFSLTIRSDCEITNVTWFSIADVVTEQQQQQQQQQQQSSGDGVKKSASLVEISPENPKYRIAVTQNNSSDGNDDQMFEVTCQMEIKHAGPIDSGKYLCRVTNGGGKTIARILSLTVVESERAIDVETAAVAEEEKPPEFVMLPETTYHAFVGDKLCLQATVRAYPKAKIVWLKGGDQQQQQQQVENDGDRVSIIELSEMESKLAFNRVVADDEADYIVVARNTVGQCQAVTHIFVKEKSPEQSADLEQKMKVCLKETTPNCTLSNVSIPDVISPPAFQATPYFDRPYEGKVQEIKQSLFKSIEVKTNNVTERDVPLSRGEFDASSASECRRLSVKELALLFTTGSNDQLQSSRKSSVSTTYSYRNRDNSLSGSSIVPPPQQQQPAIVERCDNVGASFANNQFCEDTKNSSVANKSVLRPQHTGAPLATLNQSENGEVNFERETRHVIYSYKTGFAN